MAAGRGKLREEVINMDNKRILELLLEEREMLKATIKGSERKLEHNKEKLEMVEHILKIRFGWAESEETAQEVS